MRNYLKKIFIYCPNFFLYAFYIFQRNNIILEFLFTNFSSKYNLTLKRKKDILKKIFLSFENVKSATSLEANIILLKYGLINLDLNSVSQITKLFRSRVKALWQKIYSNIA